ncbi:Ral GTPase-activating protein subunit beta-like protein [Dinothrombium tinctorium]|uniref:Ral GTPase-activating protein subunit beta-like protein n=1 Tax=Dinothrombium tinctorium TaxID=1965070 RepID=A0A3S3QMR2_9ACAR|nr:Ral GTPase-activating protein subunit beta-like protein [Dinothrombium tinctorium]
MEHNCKKCDEMYAEWATINVNKIVEENKWSILHKLPHINGQSVVNAVVKPLANSLLNSSNATPVNITSSSTNPSSLHIVDSDYTSYLRTDRDVQWVMEVICYGLSLQIFTTEQHEAVRDCVTIYCEWMYAIIPNKATTKLIPFPIRDDANVYFRRMIQHLYNVFVPRTTFIQATNGVHDFNLNDLLSRQAVLCHRVLRTLQNIAEDETNQMDNESWDMLLIFLLAINDMLLAPPAEKEDIGTQLTERVISVLFDLWIIACRRCFPAPSFWKTFMHLCHSWRHRHALIDQWSRVCLVLTQRLVQLTYDSDIRPMAFSTSSYVNNVILEMNYDIVSQTWFRFLHVIGNPVELSSPEIISKTEKFYYYANESVVDPRQHPCLNILPYNFLRAMKGLALIVDTFLGFQTQTETIENEIGKFTFPPATNQPITPPNPRKVPGFKTVTTVSKVASHKAGSHILGSFATTKGSVVNSSTQNNSQSTTPTPTPPLPTICTYPTKITFSQSRPKINSVLNVLGNWLFEACLIGSEHKTSIDSSSESVGEFQSSASASYASSNDQNVSRKGSLGVNASGDRINIDPSLSLENFESGQAEAIGALCRLFSSKKTGEEILPVYLARFYLVLQHGLSTKENVRCLLLSSILMDSTKLFQLNLNGINILIPHFLRAMELVIFEKDSKSKFSIVELRRASISILLSMLSYPLHFTALPIKDCLTETTSVVTFQSLRSRLINLMINALQTETDSTNAQMLLTGFLTIVQDAAMYETENGGSNNAADFRSRQSPFTSDTAVGLFARTLYLVCHLLISNWKNDTQVSLAALEMLSGMARIRFHGNENPLNVEDCKRATKWICDYIVNQCSRPPPFHSKDMHSAIVAAYQCLTVWFHEHSYLLQDKECVSTLMEVIELGISGSKSKSKDKVVLKAEKELKPASMRVREAAEVLQTCLMNHFGYCSSAPCSPEEISGCSLIDEIAIAKYLGLENVNLTFEEVCKHFKIFVANGSLVLSFVNDRFANRSLCIIRSPFGKYCWSFKYQLLPLKSNRQLNNDAIQRPAPSPHISSRNHIVPRFFPEIVDKIPLTKLDTTIPSLESTYSDPKSKQDHEKILKIVEKQIMFEKDIQKKCFNSVNTVNCKKPVSVAELECTRLILSHFGYLSLDSIEETNQSFPPLVCLDTKNPDIGNDIKNLDMISTRTSDTIFIFYVRKGRIHPQEILNSVSSKHYVCPQFIEFLNSIGTSVNASTHCGWTGKIETSWKINEDEGMTTDDYNVDHGGAIYDGQRMTLFWADISHELAFIVPSGRFQEDDGSSIELNAKNRTRSMDSDHLNDHRSVSSLSDDGTSASSQSRTYSDADSSRSSWKKKNKQLSLIGNIGCDTKILVIWLENLEDEYNVPIQSLLTTTNTGIESDSSLQMEYIAIFIHPLKNGLFRIKINGSLESRVSFALPLLDGMVVSQRILGVFLRLTTLNICRRRRFVAERY